MNRKVVILIAAIVGICLVGAVAVAGVYFKFFAAGEPVAKAPPPPTDSDGDSVPDPVEQEAGTNPFDAKEFPAYGNRPASHETLLIAAEGGISASSVIGPDDLEARRFARGTYRPDNVVPASRRDEIIGRIAREEIKGGDFIQPTKLYEGQQLSYVVPRFKRAVSLRYDELSAVSGMVKPGDLVDVIALFSVDRRADEREVGAPVDYAKVVLQAAKVLAIGQDFGMPPPSPPQGESAPPPPPPPPTSVTLAVTPSEAEALVWAEANASSLRMALRAPGAENVAATAGVARYDIYPARLRNKGKVIQVWTGAYGAEEVEIDALDGARRGVSPLPPFVRKSEATNE